MSQVFGIYKEGHVILDSPVDWPDGARVSVTATEPAEALAPEERTALLARLDAMEPLELTPEDEAETAAARDAVRQASLRAVRARMGLDP